MSSSTKADMVIDWCSHEAASFAVEHWHYSRTMPGSKLAKLGVWEQGRFIGALIFGLGATGNLGAPYGLSTFQVVELQRVALAQHRAPVSRIVMVAVRIVRRRFKGLRLVLSYADPSYGHHGGIYQAMGWIYTGGTMSSRALRLPDGQLLHSRAWSATGYKKHYGKIQRVFSSKDGVVVRLPSKHRYIYPLDDQIRAVVEERRLPYPRQKDSSEPSAHRAEEGGAAPTLALQERKA